MKILAIESSCDETAAAIVEDGMKVHSNVIASQIPAHAKTGGVVPEVAAREHVSVILPVIQKALDEAELTWEDIDAIAVTQEPGLLGSLIVGRITAQALAFARDLPLIKVNHIHGHMYSSWLGSTHPPQFPILTLTVSGGHNELVLQKSHDEKIVLGESIDDAAGEAFDKVARLLKLGFPGGPIIEERAKAGNPAAVDFPRAAMEGYDFSFSGLKTAVLYYLQKNESELENEVFVNDVAASFQQAVIDALVQKLMLAVQDHRPAEVHLTGGVSANRTLRGHIEEALSHLENPPLFRHPRSLAYCTDNAAMIGAAAFFQQH